MGEDFMLVKKALYEEFLLVLLHQVEAKISRQVVTSIPVKHTDLSLQDQNKTSQGNWMASCVITRHLNASLWIHVKFRSGDHVQLLRYGHA